MARTYETVGWQDGSVLQPAKVTVQGTEYEVTPEVISGTTPVNATNLRKMDNEIKKIVEEDIPSVLDVRLIAVSDTAPAECVEGDKYYNTTNNKIYTAIGTDTWGTETEDAVQGINYIVFETQTSYAYNGTTLVSVGGGSGGTNNYPDLNNLPSINGVELVGNKSSSNLGIPNAQNVESNSTTDAYSCDYINDRNTYSTDETFTGNYWIDGKKIYRKVLQGGSVSTSSVTYTNTGVNNISLVINQEGYGLTNNGSVFPLNRANGSSFQYQSTFFFDKPNNRFTLETSSSVSFTSYYIIMEYTKTTD